MRQKQLLKGSTSPIKDTAKHAIVYATGMILGKAVGFLLIPLYTRVLTPSDYGTLELLTMSMDLLAILFWTGLTSAMSRFYYHYDDPESQRTVISTGFLTAIGLFFSGSLFAFSISSYLSKLIFQTDHYTVYFRIMAVTMFIQVGVEVPLTYLRIRQQSVRFTLFSFIKVLIQFSLNVLLVAVLRLGVLGVLYSTLFTSIVMSSYLSVTAFRAIGFQYSWPYAKSMIIFGAPLIFSTLGAFIINFSDRYFIKTFLTPREVGLYALGYKFGWLISFLITAPFSQIWSAKMYDIATSPDATHTYSRIFFYMNLVLILTGLGISLYIDNVISFISAEAYWEASKVTPIIVLSYIINGWFMYTQIGLWLMNRTSYFAYVTTGAAAANLILNYFLISYFSIYGAACATFLTILLRFSLVYLVSQSLYRIQYRWLRVAFLLLSAVLIYVSSMFVHIRSVLLAVSFKTLLFLLFATLVYCGAGLSPRDRSFLRRVMRAPFSSLTNLFEAR